MGRLPTNKLLSGGKWDQASPGPAGGLDQWHQIEQIQRQGKRPEPRRLEKQGRNTAAQEALVLSWDLQRGDTDFRTQCTTGTSLSLRGLCRHVLSGTWHVPDGIWSLAGWQTGSMVRLICTYKIHPSEKHTSGLKTAHLSRTETLIWAIHRKLVIYVRAKNEKGKARFMSTG